MSVVGSRAHASSGQIWCVLLRFYISTMLRWLELVKGWAKAQISVNKTTVCVSCLFFCVAVWLLFLLPAGRGGEGEEKGSMAAR
jgi:hypothetical protein